MMIIPKLPKLPKFLKFLKFLKLPNSISLISPKAS